MDARLIPIFDIETTPTVRGRGMLHALMRVRADLFDAPAEQVMEELLKEIDKREDERGYLQNDVRLVSNDRWDIYNRIARLVGTPLRAV